MQLNAAEKALMNNPLRAALQRRYEARLLRRLGGRTDGAHVLEVGCGRGVGAEIAIEEFGAARVDAFDLDPDMVERARSRLARYGERVKLWVGDATAIEAPDDTYEAVFASGSSTTCPTGGWRSARWPGSCDPVAGSSSKR